MTTKNIFFKKQKKEKKTEKSNQNKYKRENTINNFYIITINNLSNN